MMRYSAGAIVTIAMLLVGTQSLLAQEGHLAAGTRVRVTAPGTLNARVTGGVVEVGSDELSIRLEKSNALVHVPLESVKKIEISRGMSGNAGKGALWGGVITGGSTLIYAILVSTSDYYDVDPGDVAKATAFGVVSGAAVGALIGALWKTEKWKSLPLDNVGLQIEPKTDGVAVGVSIRL